jgi:hypothetical protein
MFQFLIVALLKKKDGNGSENDFFATSELIRLKSKGGSLMAPIKTLLISLPEYFGGQNFLLSALLICALVVTYCWSVLGTKLKLTLCFSVGVFMFKALFDQLIDQRLFPDLHSYVPYMLGGLTAGLLEIGAFLIANRTVIVGIFFVGAIFPLLCLAHTSAINFAGSLFALLLIAAAIAILNSLAVLKVTRTKLFQMVLSAIAGSLGVVYFTSFPGVASNWQFLGINGIRTISRTMHNSRLYSAVCLAISGLIVQSLFHLALRQIRRPKQEPFT